MHLIHAQSIKYTRKDAVRYTYGNAPRTSPLKNQKNNVSDSSKSISDIQFAPKQVVKSHPDNITSTAKTLPVLSIIFVRFLFISNSI